MTITLIELVENTIYDRSGIPLAYLSGNQVIYRFDGQPVGYVISQRVLTFLGTHVGWLRDGWLRSLHGFCVGFTNAARNAHGPGLPTIRHDPHKAQKRPLPTKNGRKESHDALIIRSTWSHTPLKVYLAWVQYQAGD